MEQNNVNDQLLTKKEVAALYKCSIRTIEKRVKLGMLTKHLFGGTVYFKRCELPILNKTA